MSRMRCAVRVLAVGLLLASAASCTDDSSWLGAGASGSGVEAEFARMVDEAVERDDVAGVVAAVRFGDGEEWVHAAGVSDVDSAALLSAESTWPLRSVTKSFTVTLLLELVDEGVLSLDDLVSDHVDGVTNGDEITLEQLALMTSGLPEYANEAFVEDFVEDFERDFSDDELLGYIAGEDVLFEPGEEHVYINTNTLLLGMVITEATGTPVGQLIEERLVEPLGLSGTRYQPSTRDVAAEVPVGYQPDGEGLAAQPLTFSVFGGAGAMSSTVSDLLDWGAALAEGSEISAELHDRRLETAAPLAEGPEYDSYGLGIGEIDGWWGHTGEGIGYTTLVMHDRGSGATVVIFANVSNLEQHLPTHLFRKIAAALES